MNTRNESSFDVALLDFELQLQLKSYSFSSIIYVRLSLCVHVLHIAFHKMVTSSESSIGK